MKTRLDQLLVDRGLVESREKAKALILAGEVMVNGQKSGKAGQGVADHARVDLLARPKYVSRGGLKLEDALAAFAIDVADKVCIDIGASTGGFTDCLLQHGARRVYAFDVGTAQLDWKIRTDPRVVAREQFNCRNLSPADVGEPCDLAVCDVSFISVTLLLAGMKSVLRENGEMVILVKPQFEAGRGEVGKGGIVRDPAVHVACCEKVERAVRELGFGAAIRESPILGAEGNKEFLLYACDSNRRINL